MLNAKNAPSPLDSSTRRPWHAPHPAEATRRPHPRPGRARAGQCLENPCVVEHPSALVYFFDINQNFNAKCCVKGGVLEKTCQPHSFGAWCFLFGQRNQCAEHGVAAQAARNILWARNGLSVAAGARRFSRMMNPVWQTCLRFGCSGACIRPTVRSRQAFTIVSSICDAPFTWRV